MQDNTISEEKLVLKYLSKDAHNLDNSVKNMAFLIYIFKKEFLTNELIKNELIKNELMKNFMKSYAKLYTDSNDIFCKYKIKITLDKDCNLNTLYSNFQDYLCNLTKNNLNELNCNISKYLKEFNEILYNKEEIDLFSLINSFATKFTENNLGLEVMKVIDESKNNIIKNSNIVRSSIIGIVAFLIIAGIVFVCIKKSNSNNKSKNSEIKNDESDNLINI